MDAARIESLHEAASSRYLQGDLEGARSAWLEVLAADPADERALEGVRLCDQSIGARSESVCTGHSPFAVGSLHEDLPDLAGPQPAGGHAAGPPGELDLSEISDEIEEPEPAWTSPWQVIEEPSDAAHTVPPVHARSGIEPSPPRSAGTVGAPPEEASADLPPQAAPSMTEKPAPAPWQFGEAPAAARKEDAARSVAASAAEIELRRRVNELIAEALRAVECGDPENARRTVNRILILDEQNETALSLLSKLGGGVSGESKAALPAEELNEDPPPPLEGLGPWEPHVQDPELAAAPALELDRPPQPELEAPGPLPSFEVAIPEGDDTPSVAAGLIDEGVPALEDLLGPDPAVQPVAVRTRWRLPSLSKRAWILVGASSVLVLVLGAVGSFLGGAEEAALPSAPAGAEHASGEDGGGAREAKPRSGGAAKRAASKDAAAAAPSSSQDRLQVALASAERAEAEGDAGAVVVALAEALELRPDDANLRAQFDEAAASYRAQQESERKWQDAIKAFEGGNYSHALAYFYRVPPEQMRPELERYKLNGWFNLGLLAMRAGDCREAKEHLTEARDLAAADPDVRTALELAHRCTAGDASWVDGLEALRIRRLND